MCLKNTMVITERPERAHTTQWPIYNNSTQTLWTICNKLRTKCICARYFDAHMALFRSLGNCIQWNCVEMHLYLTNFWNCLYSHCACPCGWQLYHHFKWADDQFDASNPHVLPCAVSDSSSNDTSSFVVCVCVRVCLFVCRTDNVGSLILCA